MAVTISQIASLAGVAQSTASRALSSGNQRINPETKKKVREIARQLKYMPNASARLLVQKKTNAIGFYWNHGTVMVSASLTQMMTGISSVISDNNYNLLVALRGQGRNPSARLTSERLVDGMIIGHDQDQPVLDAFRYNNIPVVLAYMELREDFDSATIANSAAAAECVKYLAGLGHRHIGYLNNTITGGHVASEKQRIQGYMSEMLNQGLRGCVGYKEKKTVAQRIEDLFSADELPTALICYDDEVAYQAVKCLLDRGLRIPQDVSVIGFNDSEFARLSPVPLTSVTVPMDKLGSKVAEMLLGRIQNPDIPPRQVSIPTELVVRASTGAVKLG